MASKQSINQIELDGIVYEFIDSQARDDTTALNKKVVSLNDIQKEALSAETQRAIDAENAINTAKVDKEAGKGLSSNDFTDEYKEKIDNQSPMQGATAQDDGKAGSVPAPLAGDQDKYLDGSGNWSLPIGTTYEEATHQAAGLMSRQDKIKLDKLGEDDEVLSCNTVFNGNIVTSTFGNGKTKKTTFNDDGSIVTEITQEGTSKITLTTVFNADGSITRTRS